MVALQLDLRGSDVHKHEELVRPNMAAPAKLCVRPRRGSNGRNGLTAAFQQPCNSITKPVQSLLKRCNRVSIVESLIEFNHQLSSISGSLAATVASIWPSLQLLGHGLALWH